MKLSHTILFSALWTRATSQSIAFDAREATVESVHAALFTGSTTCRDVVSSFLNRIEALNHHVNAIVALNPDALNDADALDGQLLRGNASSALFCILILLKDNNNTANMPTTGGCIGLKDSRPSRDAPSVVALKAAGAVILGKANLHELALEGLSVSSYGGQTINPYDSSRTPGGSSGGSAAAVAASFSVFATGTDTVNLLRSPASANSLFSIRPTRGLISRAGVIPVRDALGVIARSVADLAIALDVMARRSYGMADNTTALIPKSSIERNYWKFLDAAPLRNARLGLVTTFFNMTSSSETDPVNAAMDTMLTRLEAAGAIIIPISDPIYNSSAILSKLDTQRFEYRESMDAYLSQSSLGGVHPTFLQELYTTDPGRTGGQFLVTPAQYEYVKKVLASSTSNSSYVTVQSGNHELKLALQKTFQHHTLDALIYPQQQNLVVKIGSPSQSGRNGILGAVTGSPVITVPIGFSNVTNLAPLGVPVGMEILGQPWDEQRLLNIARSIEMLGRVRRTPGWANQIVEQKNNTEVPQIVPDSGNIHSNYPVGKL